MSLDEAKQEWVKGFACAAGIVGYIDGPAAAQQLLKEGGFQRSDLEEAKCEQIDIARIYGEEYEG